MSGLMRVQDAILRSDTEGMLAFQGKETTANIPAPMRERAAQLFRCGMILGAAPSGHGQLSSPLPDPPGAVPAAVLAAGDGVSEVGFHGATPHADGAPAVACPLLSVGSDVDVVWPDVLCKRWADLAGMAPPRDAADGRRAHAHVTIGGEAHLKVQHHKETMAACFAEVGVAAAALAASRQSTATSAPVSVS
jgi:hypothetical protein